MNQTTPVISGRPSPINFICSENFHEAWAEAIRFVMRHEYEIIFGHDAKNAYDSTQTISLTGAAIDQILRRELHPAAPFKSVDAYCEEFTREYLRVYLNRPVEEKFDYLYAERLMGTTGCCDDQIEEIWGDILDQRRRRILSNKCQATTWNRCTDPYAENTPCLQSIWVRYITGDLIDVHLRWRSRDLFNAWQPNLIAIVSVIHREIASPTECKIARVVDACDSLHIYKTDTVPDSVLSRPAEETYDLLEPCI